MKRAIFYTVLGLLALNFVFVSSLSSRLPVLAIVLCGLAVAFAMMSKRGMLGWFGAVVLFCLATLTVEFSVAPKQPRNSVAIVGGSLITGLSGADVLHNGTILIDEAGSIVAVGDAAEIDIPGGVEVIDASGKFLMPGLVNAHTHLWRDGNDPDEPLDVGDWLSSEAAHDLSVLVTDTYVGRRLIAYTMEKSAKQELFSGVTTLRSIGEIGFLDVDLRDRIAQGKVVGPNLVVAGKILAVTGGHASEIGMVFNGPVEARKAVREALRNKVDFIKITSTGGVSDSRRKGEAGELQMTPEEIRALVDEAHRKNILVAAHAESTQGVREALEAGVDNIEHGALLDDELVELFRNNPASLRGFTSLHATLSIFAGEVKVTPEIQAHPILSVMAHNAVVVGEQVTAGFRQALAGGVLTGLGTDSGFISHEAAWKELKYFMEEGGVSAGEAIHLGTLATARSIGLEKVTGSLEQGKRADLLVLDGDPREDLSLIGRPSMVVANGYLHSLRPLQSNVD